MNECAALMMEQYPDIAFGYGFGSEYRYVVPI
jgi:tRNA(His) 5'-end guanylyltransferase